MSVGRVVFSLDFELGWGHRRSRPSYVEQLRSRQGTVRKQIEELIALFDRYDVPATWAVVGKLVEPGDDQLFHAPDLFESLLDSGPAHDIGLHSFSHEPYDRLSASAAREDLADGIGALEGWGCPPDSFVFPQNRIAHLDLLGEQDLRCYRGKQEDSSLSLRRLFTPETFDRPTSRSQPVRVPSSVFLAARRPSWYRRRYALRGLERTVDRQGLVHYWLHPHNVVTDSALVDEIETVLEAVRSMEDDGKIQIRTVTQVADDCLT